MKKIYTDEDFEKMDHNKDLIREYFTDCATSMFQRANNMPASKEKLTTMKTALILFKYMDEFVESSYKEPK